MRAIKKILCPIDLSDVSGDIADYAAQQADCTGAQVVVLHVEPALYLHADTDVPYSIEEKFLDESSKNAWKFMEKFVPEHFPKGNAVGKVVSGYAPESIIEMVKDENFDMVVIGTHGMKAMHVMVFGSVAEKVLKLSPVPVLLVRPSKHAL
ncbi:MAG: universal stress protein [Desulfovibrionaceae bacterium]